MTKQFAGGRKDRFSPRGYHRGFIHPSRMNDQKPLWVQDLPRRHWQLRSPTEFGYIRGLYDYSSPAPERGSAEDAFRMPENDFPTAREDIRRRGYGHWECHREIFVQFAAMLSTRTPTFIKQVKAFAQGSDSSSPETQDCAIDIMRAEIRDRYRRWRHLHWALRYTADPDNAVITGNHCIGVEGNLPSLQEAFTHPETTLFFPLSWDMCLFAAPVELSPLTHPFHPIDLERLREFVFKQAEIFIVATIPLFFKRA